MAAQRELRTQVTKVALESRDDGKKPLIQGYSALFKSEAVIYDLFRESIEPGAFAPTIAKGQRVVSLFNHDANYVLGSTSSGTLRLREDATGLWMEVEPPDTQVGRDVVEYIRRGDVEGQSFMFEIVRQKWTFAQNKGEMDLRVIEEVNLMECGPVLFPAYQDTSVGLRSLAEEAHTQARSQYEEAIVQALDEKPQGVSLDLLYRRFRLLQLSA